VAILGLVGYGATLSSHQGRLRLPPQAAPAEGRPKGAAAPLPRGGPAPRYDDNAVVLDVGLAPPASGSVGMWS
jgi:hypothetical protein